jgi:hypothetical protein
MPITTEVVACEFDGGEWRTVGAVADGAPLSSIRYGEDPRRQRELVYGWVDKRPAVWRSVAAVPEEQRIEEPMTQRSLSALDLVADLSDGHAELMVVDRMARKSPCAFRSNDDRPDLPARKHIDVAPALSRTGSMSPSLDHLCRACQRRRPTRPCSAVWINDLGEEPLYQPIGGLQASAEWLRTVLSRRVACLALPGRR